MELGGVGPQDFHPAAGIGHGQHDGRPAVGRQLGGRGQGVEIVAIDAERAAAEGLDALFQRLDVHVWSMRPSHWWPLTST